LEGSSGIGESFLPMVMTQLRRISGLASSAPRVSYFIVPTFSLIFILILNKPEPQLVSSSNLSLMPYLYAPALLLTQWPFYVASPVDYLEVSFFRPWRMSPDQR